MLKKANPVKPVLVATSIKQATCIKQACNQIPKQASTLKCTCIKQAPVLSKQILIVPWCLLNTGWTVFDWAFNYDQNYFKLAGTRFKRKFSDEFEREQSQIIQCGVTCF